jgi:dihydroorotase
MNRLMIRNGLRLRSSSHRSASSLRASSTDSISISRPDDWHLHLRDGAAMQSVLPHTTAHFSRAVVMPNLTPPVVSVHLALEYKQRIINAVPSAHKAHFNPLMTLYLTDKTTPDEVHKAKSAGIVAFKLYPAGATTNSDSGVTDINKVLPALKAMADAGVLLLVHGEVTDAHVDMFDREAVFIREKLIPLVEKIPDLKIIMEHITTREAAEFVASSPSNIAATITPQHMLLNRNALFVKGLRPHNYCLPVLKREVHREAVLKAAISGSPKFFLGTDSAPHAKNTKEAACGCAGIYSAPIAMSLYAQAFDKAGALDKLEGFASFHGPDFYGLPRNKARMTLKRVAKGDGRAKIPDSYPMGDTVVVPMWAGEELEWIVADP